MISQAGDVVTRRTGASLQWRVHLTPDGIDTYIYNDVYSESFSSDGSVDDLDKSALAVRNAFETLGRTAKGTPAFERNMEALATEASNAFGLLLGRDFAKLEGLRDELDLLPPNAHVQIVSENFSFPWELVLPRRGVISGLEELLGWRFIVQRHLGRMQPRIRDPKRRSTEPLRLGLMSFDGLKNVRSIELPYLRKLFGSVVELPRLDDKKRKLGMQAFERFLSGSFDVIHFAGHARGSGVGTPILWVSAEFPISYAELTETLLNVASRLSTKPYVFLNACETSNTSSVCTACLARVFLKAGALAVIATECHIPDAEAAVICEALYTKLLTGAELGDTVLHCRRSSGCVFGVAYSMYGSPSCQFLFD